LHDACLVGLVGYAVCRCPRHFTMLGLIGSHRPSADRESRPVQ
jgi:hypothetical protein